MIGKQSVLEGIPKILKTMEQNHMNDDKKLVNYIDVRVLFLLLYLKHNFGCFCSFSSHCFLVGCAVLLLSDQNRTP